MRLQPVAASPLARVAKRDLHFSDGTVIPAGVLVEAAQYTPMRDERWGWHRGTEFLPVRPPSCLSGKILPVLWARADLAVSARIDAPAAKSGSGA